MSEEKLERILDILVDHANSMEVNAVNMKRQIAEIVGVKGVTAVKEETFSILKFDKQQGNRIGEFGVAYAKANIRK